MNTEEKEECQREDCCQSEPCDYPPENPTPYHLTVYGRVTYHTEEVSILDFASSSKPSVSIDNGMLMIEEPDAGTMHLIARGRWTRTKITAPPPDEVPPTTRAPYARPDTN